MTTPPDADRPAPDAAPEGRARGRWAVAAALAALVALDLLVATYDWSRPSSPRLRLPPATGGDQYHYVLMATSVARDRDLDLGGNYESVGRGGADAGVRAAGAALDHHTFVLAPDGRGSVLWGRTRKLPWLPAEDAGPTPDFGVLPGAPAYASDPRAVERPAHPPALSIVAGGLAALLGPASGGRVGPEGAFALVNLAAGLLGVLATYWAARAVVDPPAAAGAAALLAAASPWPVYGQFLLTELASGLLLVMGLGAVLRRRPVLAGVMVAGAFWLKPPYVCAGLAWLLVLAAGRRWREAAALAATCTAGGVALLAFNRALARTPFVAGAEGFVPARHLTTAVQTLIAPGGGLFVFAPWVVPALILSAMAARDRDRRADLAAILLPPALYYPVVSAHWSIGGYCYGPRYWVPMLPLFAVAAAYALRARPCRAGWVLMALAAAAGAAFNLAAATCVLSVMNLSPHVALRTVLRSVL